MADTKETSEKKTAAASVAAKEPAAAKEFAGEKKVKGKPSRGKPRNYDLGNGVYRFSRTRMFHKKAIYKFLGKKTPKKVSTNMDFLYKKLKANILCCTATNNSC